VAIGLIRLMFIKHRNNLFLRLQKNAFRIGSSCGGNVDLAL